MKVAIVGAGASGLACAFELKKHGITPDIFEMKGHIGEFFSLPAAFLGIFNITYKNPIRYLKHKYGLTLVPIHTINKIDMIGPSKEIKVKGKLGYVFNRGIEKNSVENQIAAQINIPVYYDSYIDVDKIRDKYDYVVSACGKPNTAKSKDLFSSSLNVYARSATVVGSFETNSVIMWINNEYAKNGFAYLMPYDSQHARVTLMINNIAYPELEFYWKEFLRVEGINYKMTEVRDMEHSLGFVYPARLDNIYFVGDAAALVDDFIGFGVLNAVESGILAAKSIVNNLDYVKLLKPIYDYRIKIHEFRKAMNTMDNDEIDRLLFFLGLPVIKQFVYNNPLFKVRQTAFLTKIYNSMNKG